MAPSQKGFTLIGVLVLLATVAIAAGVLALPVFLDLTVSREEETRRQLTRLVQAITGMPEQGTFGFVGDVGRLPKNLEELNDKNTTATTCASGFSPSAPPDFHTADGGTDHRGKLGMGWRGPYVKEMLFSDEHLNDAWGQALRYTCPESTIASSDPTTGGVAMTVRTGQIVSAGPDATFDTADDIKSDQFFDRGHFFLTVTQGGSENIARKVTVTFYFPSNGEQASLVSEPSTVAGPEGSETTIVFSSVPAGARFTQINFGGAKNELFHMALSARIVNRINVKIPVGQGGKA